MSTGDGKEQVPPLPREARLRPPDPNAESSNSLSSFSERVEIRRSGDGIHRRQEPSPSSKLLSTGLTGRTPLTPRVKDRRRYSGAPGFSDSTSSGSCSASFSSPLRRRVRGDPKTSEEELPTTGTGGRQERHRLDSGVRGRVSGSLRGPRTSRTRSREVY